MTIFTDISSALYFVGAVAIATGLVLLGVFGASIWTRKQREKREPERDFFQDVTNISILFQSMRDVLRQQKELSAELNRDMERNMAAIRKAVLETRSELDRVRQMQRDLERRLNEGPAPAPEPVAQANTPPAAAPIAAPEKPSLETRRAEPVREEPATPHRNGNGAPGHSEGRVLNILSEPLSTDTASSDSSPWVGLDFGPPDSGEPLYDGPAAAPEQPEDPQAARQAFRALLGMEENEDNGQERAMLTSVEPEKPANGSSNGVPLLSERVYDYCDAGMTVPQIARELGIGKGEVRLILSLRKDKSR